MRLLAPLLLVAILFASVALAQNSQSPAGRELKYFLHATGQCQGQGNVETFMDLKDSTGDLDGCGAVGTGGALGGFDIEYPGREGPNATVEAQSTATAQIHVRSQEPVNVKVSAVVKAGSGGCSAPAVEKMIAPQAYTLFTLSCKLSHAFNGTTKPAMTVTVESPLSYFMGYEGTHASSLAFVASSANPTSNQTSTPTKTGEDTPGPAAIVAALGLLVAVAWRRRAGA